MQTPDGIEATLLDENGGGVDPTRPQQHLIEAAMNDAANGHTGGILRFINNQYVQEDASKQPAAVVGGGGGSSAAAHRVDFVYMDPSTSRQRGYRTSVSGANGSHTETSFVEDESVHTRSSRKRQRPNKPNDTDHSSSSSISAAVSTNTTVGDAENFDLAIPNDFNKVQEIYHAYYNDLKPQVESVPKAYKIKKIRKYQKIKALAVRIDRYKDLKGISLEDSCNFFDGLRTAEDGTQRSIAWLYNTLPETLKKIGLEEQLKGKGVSAD